MYVCVCMHVCRRAWMHACSEHYSCVCRCISVEEAGAGEQEECESEIFYVFILYLLIFFNVPS